MVLLNPPVLQPVPCGPNLDDVISLSKSLRIPKYDVKSLKIQEIDATSMVTTDKLLKDIIDGKALDEAKDHDLIFENIIADDSNTTDNLKKTEDTDEFPFKIVDLAGKGTGMVATRNLFPGDLILAEKPLLFVPDEVYEDIEATEELIDKQVLKLDSSQREMLFELTDSRNPLEPTYLGIFYTNDMNYDGDAVLCPVMARANHSCVPNAEFITRRDQGEQRLVTIYPIKAGEEVTINYMSMKEEGTEMGEARREYLRKWYKFQCLCRACTLQDQCLETNEILREEIKELQAAGVENLSNEELERLVSLVFKIQGKLSYVLQLMDILFTKLENVDPFLSFKHGIKGMDLALNLEGEGSVEVAKWRSRLYLICMDDLNILQ